MTSPRRFITIWAACLVGGLLAAAAFNWVVDPYAIFGTRLPGLQDKSAAVNQPLLSKTYLMERSSPVTLLIGSSRVDVGLDPQSAAWPPDHRPVFNFGMPGATSRTQALLLRHALTVLKPAHLVIGVGLDDSLTTPRPSGAAPGADSPSPDTDRLSLTAGGEPNPRRWKARRDDFVTALLSISALGDSAMSLLQLGVKDKSTTSPSGFTKRMDFAASTQAEGANAVFTAKDRDKIASLIPWSSQQMFDLGPLADMLEQASLHGADVVVFTYPNSAEDMEIYRRLGAEKTFDRWRDQLVQIVQQSRDHGGRVTLWDFTGFTPYQTEAVPPPGSRAQLQWFWETNHFKATLGDIVISRIYGGTNEPFGIVLDSSNLSDVQRRFDAQWQSYVQANPDAVARIDRLYRAERQRLCAIVQSQCDQLSQSDSP